MLVYSSLTNDLTAKNERVGLERLDVKTSLGGLAGTRLPRTRWGQREVKQGGIFFGFSPSTVLFFTESTPPRSGGGRRGGGARSQGAAVRRRGRAGPPRRAALAREPAARWREARGPFVRPERAPQSRAVAGTGRVHTASERGQWSLDGSTSAKPSSFAIQPLSARLSCKLPTLISRGWRGRKPAEAGPRRVRGALGGSPPPSGRSRGDAASCTLTCLDGPRVFVSVSKGAGRSLTPARCGGGGHGVL